MLLDIVRFIAFLLVFAGYVWIGMRLFNLRQRLSVGPKQYRLFLLAAAEAALVWAFVVAVLLVLASYWTPGLLVTAIVFAWTSVGLAWTLQSLSGGPPEKSSALTAAFGTSAVLRVGIVVLQMMAALAFVVWCACLLFTNDEQDISDQVLIANLVFLFVSMLLQQVLVSGVLASPYLDDGTRQGGLNGSFSNLIAMLFVLSVLLPSLGFDTAGWEIAAGVSVSLPVVVVLVVVFAFGGLIPYLSGTSKSRNLRYSYADRLRSLMQQAANALSMPIPGYAQRLGAVTRSVEAEYRQMVDAHPLLRLEENSDISKPRVDVTSTSEQITAFDESQNDAPAESVLADKGMERLPDVVPEPYDEQSGHHGTAEFLAGLGISSSNRELQSVYIQKLEDAKVSDPRFAYLRHLSDLWEVLELARVDVLRETSAGRRARIAHRWAEYVRALQADLPRTDQTRRPIALSAILAVTSIVISTVLSKLGDEVWDIFTTGTV